MLERHLNDGLLTLRLAHGKASALDLELCEELRIAFESAAEDPTVRSVVLTGSGNIFSAGVDLPRMITAGGDYVQQFVEALDGAFRALFLFPKPVIAAMNGHAIAGGAILAFACDHRIMSGGRIGVPEALVGVPFPPLALEIVRFGVPQQYLQTVVYFGGTFESETAKTMGLVDEIVAGGELMTRAAAVARQFASIAPAAFSLTKRQIREPYLRDAAHVALDSTEQIDALWGAPETHDRIREYLARTLKK